MLADNSKNGILDIFENTPEEGIFANTMKIIVDGKEFNSIDDLPPEARAKYEQAIGALDANRNGVPDFLEGMIKVQPNPTPAPKSYGAEPTPSLPRMLMSVESPTITPDTSNGWMLGLLAFSILFFCLLGAAGVWYFFLR